MPVKFKLSGDATQLFTEDLLFD